MTDANYTDDLVLLTNTPAQAEFLLHSLKQAAGCCKPLKLVDQFRYLGSNISSTESNVNICIDCSWQVITQIEIQSHSIK